MSGPAAQARPVRRALQHRVLVDRAGVAARRAELDPCGREPRHVPGGAERDHEVRGRRAVDQSAEQIGPPGMVDQAPLLDHRYVVGQAGRPRGVAQDGDDSGGAVRRHYIIII